MIDYSNVVEPMRCRARSNRRLGRFALALVVLGSSLCWCIAGGTDRRPVEVKKLALVEFTSAQINTMRAMAGC
jgi:hypothetical protein